MNKGYLYGIGAYLIWGFLPIYWKLLEDVPAMESLSSRIVWSLVLIGLLLAVRHHWRWLRPAVKDWRIMLTFLLSGSILAVNWGTYIWAVNADQVVETSLGYFINPLVSVLMGVWFLQERLRRGQWTAVAVAALGVLYLTIIHGSLPWIALTLAFSFATYGYIRKTAALGALEGLTLETAWLFLPALGVLLYLHQQGQGHLAQGDWQTTLLLLGTGVITAVPLLWFSTAARLIPLSSVGILQYIAPTCQFAIGIFLYREPFSPAQLVGFACIWLALLIYATEGVRYNRRLKLARATGSA
ncbi:MAG: EamA family transporter RarD [Anaerolineae bacterium]|nr:EamA family transporter RarD [Anaerolineae bacterium]